MCFPRPGRFTAQFLGVCSIFFAFSASAAADPPAFLDGVAAGVACAAPDADRCPDAFPQFVSPAGQPWIQPLPPVDDAAADPYPVQAASHWNEALEMESCEPSRCLDFLSLDDLRQEIRRRDAAASSPSNYGRGMTLVLDDGGKKYIRFLTWAQVWTTFTENNPGTVDAYDELKDHSLDIGLRRTRFLMYSQLNEKYLILLHMGINNQTFTNGGGSGTGGIGGYGAGKKPQIFVHDIWNEYAVIPASECRDFSLSMGAGLLYWNGVSRKASASTLGFMTLDAPVFCWQDIELTDQFARQLGWYAKGKFHKLDYRFSVTQPFNADNRAALNREQAVNIAADSLAYAGYFDWQFWDQESDLLPYRTSSWLGEKSVFNIGAGFYYHPDSSGIGVVVEGDKGAKIPVVEEKQDQVAVGIDCYFDKPVGDCGAALTLYGVYYIFDFGDNYYRDIGIMNTGLKGSDALLAAKGITPTISGAGNAQPFMGTGEIFYLEGGYVLPSWILGEAHGRLQPFAAFAHKNLDWLDDPAVDWDVGVNYLIDGHRSKLTFQHSWRPQFFNRTEGDTVRRVSDGSGGQFIIQAQIAL